MRIVTVVAISFASAARHAASRCIGRPIGHGPSGFGRLSFFRVLMTTARPTLGPVSGGRFAARGHSSSILLPTLVGRVLLDVPLAILLAQVFRSGPAFRARVDSRALALALVPPFGAAARRRNRRKLCLGYLPSLASLDQRSTDRRRLRHRRELLLRRRRPFARRKPNAGGAGELRVSNAGRYLSWSASAASRLTSLLNRLVSPSAVSS
jgi:hypothetical protein